jgi:23S rRNA (guanosine2251-2'-O)-methyltransferase
VQQIVEECRRLGVPLRFEPREAVDRIAAGGVHQGVVALASSKSYARLEDILGGIEPPGLLVVLDEVQDPHNLGAIVRSAHAAGAHAVIFSERRSVGLTETVAKAAAGALEHLAIARVTNLHRALEELKANGYWIIGLDERAETAYDDADYKGNVALVLGGEGKGLRRLTTESCDHLVRIPVAGKIGSLNVSVAAGVVLFEVLRQRKAVNRKP